MQIDNIDEIEKFVEEMNYFFTNIERTNSDLKNELRTKELEQDDLLHEIELSNLNAFELTKVAGRLKKTRQQRREIKDKLDFIATIKGFSDKYNNKLITGDLINLLKNIRKLRENWNTRIYKTRVLEDLKVSKMIVVSQNKTEFINFDNVMNIEMTDCEEDGYLIAAGFIVGRDDNYRELGYYKTEARAKEIIKEIWTAYSNFNYFKNATADGKNYVINLLKHKYEQFDIYEMPKE